MRQPLYIQILAASAILTPLSIALILTGDDYIGPWGVFAAIVLFVWMLLRARLDTAVTGERRVTRGEQVNSW